MNDATSLADLFFSADGKLVDKWEHYLAIYEQELGAIRAAGRPVRLLEIGTQNGGSLELWRRYLPAGSSILGLDIDPRVAALRFDSDHIRVRVADATNPSELDAVLGDERFDIIIDDGSHVCADICRTFELLFPRLNPGGRFIIEDLHCSYFPSHGGSLRGPGSAIEHFKGLVDALNADHLTPADAAGDGADRLRDYNRTLARVAFFESVTVVEKLAHEKVRPYRRLLSGNRADIQPFENWVGIAAPEHLRLLLLGDLAASRMDEAVIQSLEDMRNANAISIAELGGQIAALNAEVARLTAMLAERQAIELATSIRQEH
jgi:uncharacterized small protein (DUF1192 family)